MRLRRLFAMVGATTTAIVISVGAVPVSAGAATTPLTLSTTTHSGTGMTGASVTDSAVLDGQSPDTPASGTVTYSLSHGTCSAVGTPVDNDTETLDGTGLVPDSKSFGPLGADNYVFQVTYSGDTTYSQIDSANAHCEDFTIAPVTLTLATTPDPDTGMTGASVSDSASLSGQTSITATGSVTYTLDNGTCASPGTQVGSDSDSETLDSSGNVPPSVAFGPLGAGSYALEVTYSGDPNYSAITTPKCDPFTITQGALTLVTMPMTGTGEAGVSVTDNASLNPQAPGVPATGTVTYTLDNGTCAAPGSPIGTDTESVSAGVPDSSNPYGPLAAGSYIFVVSYSGDTNYTSSSPTADCEAFTLAQFAPGVSSTVTDVQTGGAWVNGGATEVVGQSAFDSAAVTGTTGEQPTGTVTYRFYTGSCASGTQIGTDDVQNLSAGVPAHSTGTAALGAGTYSYSATYSGDTNYSGPVTGPCESFSVGQVAPTLATTAHTGTGSTGASVSDSATLNGQVSGFVASGTVTYTLDHGTCASPGSQVGTDTETLDGTGHVPDSKLFGPLGAGSYVFEVTYSGDTNYTASTTADCEAFSLAKLAPALATTPDTGSNTPGTSVSDTAVLNGQVSGFVASGTVTYTLDHGTCASPGSQVGTDTESVTAGVPNSSNPYGPLAAGSYVFVVTYSGDTNYTGSTTADCEALTLAQFAPGVSTTVTDVQTGTAWVNGGPTEVVGQSAFDSAGITGTTGTEPPTGTVTYRFFSGSCASGTQVGPDDVENLSAGVPAHSTGTAALGAGTYSYSATYSGDTNYSGPVTGPCESFSVAPGSLTLATTPNTGTGSSGTSVRDSATLTGQVSGFAATGTVTYKLFTGTCGSRGTQMGGNDTVTIDGSGNVPPSVGFGPLTTGSYLFLDSFSPGDANYAPAQPSTCEPFAIGRAAPTSPVITDIPNSAVAGGAFTASVSTNGDGVRSVASQSPSVCAVGGDGVTVTYVAAGNCTLTAQVSGGTNYLSAAGNPQIFGISPQPRGYWLVGTDGGIFSFGAAAFHGSMGGIPLQRPVVGITPTASRNGYWLVASDGGIFSFGDSAFYGSIPGLGLHPAGSRLPNSLNAPIVGMVPSSTGHGYFMIASDGGVFAFGDARFAGSCPGIGGCAGTAVAVMPDHSGNGYWLVTAAGAVYAFGDAPFFGSPPPTGAQAVSAVATPDGNGYWIVDNNGAVWAFGDANAMGAPVGYVNVFNPATAIFPTSDGHGYWVAAARGDVFSYGDAPYLGSMAARGLNGQIIAGYGF